MVPTAFVSWLRSRFETSRYVHDVTRSQATTRIDLLEIITHVPFTFSQKHPERHRRPSPYTLANRIEVRLMFDSDLIVVLH